MNCLRTLAAGSCEGIVLRSIMNWSFKVTTNEPVGRVVKIFITGQDPRSLRTVELDNWTGVAITGQPEFFKKALEAEVLSRSCVYLLIRSSADDDLPEVYVGESNDFSQRYTSGKFPNIENSTQLSKA